MKRESPILSALKDTSLSKFIEATTELTNSSLFLYDCVDKQTIYCSKISSFNSENQSNFPLNQIVEEEVEFYLRAMDIGINGYKELPIQERKIAVFTMDIHFKHQLLRKQLLHVQFLPFQLTTSGELKTLIGFINKSNRSTSGNIQLFLKKSSLVKEYDIKTNRWMLKEKPFLSEREYHILYYYQQGLDIQKTAQKLSVSSATVKFHRRKMFHRFKATNMAQISAACQNHKRIKWDGRYINAPF